MPATTKHLIGDSARLRVTFKDAWGTINDPNAVSFKIKEPDGTTTSYVYHTDAQLVRESQGVYYVDWPITKTGAHYVHYNSTGSLVATRETVFTARASAAV